MAKIGTFKIERSLKLTGRGLVALGQILEGCVRVGSYTSFEYNDKRFHMQIAGVDMADTNRQKGEFAAGLTFVYKDILQRQEFEAMKLIEQIIDIVDES